MKILCSSAPKMTSMLVLLSMLMTTAQARHIRGTTADQTEARNLQARIGRMNKKKTSIIRKIPFRPNPNGDDGQQDGGEAGGLPPTGGKSCSSGLCDIDLMCPDADVCVTNDDCEPIFTSGGAPACQNVFQLCTTGDSSCPDGKFCSHNEFCIPEGRCVSDADCKNNVFASVCAGGASCTRSKFCECASN